MWFAPSLPPCVGLGSYKELPPGWGVSAEAQREIESRAKDDSAHQSKDRVTNCPVCPRLRCFSILKTLSVKSRRVPGKLG